MDPTPEPILTKLHGDASNRIYYRAQSKDGRTWIVMKLPQGASSISEEIQKDKPKELPFLNIARFLEKQGLPVPKILHYDPENRQILLEDLGDETLEKRLIASPPQAMERWYQKAIDLLVKFQNKTQKATPGCLAFGRSFEADLLQWEFQHFVEYGIEARTGQKVSEEDKKTIEQGTKYITFALCQLPQTLVHRDFQSRNLMVSNESLKLLDFQDALMGPLPYDLVALLRDSYIELPWEGLENLMNYYMDQSSPQLLGVLKDPFLFKKMFDWMTIQRKLKDAGRFVYIDRVKKNPSFLKHIPSSLRYVRGAFERQTELGKLFEVLKKYVPEFQ